MSSHERKHDDRLVAAPDELAESGDPVRDGQRANELGARRPSRHAVDEATRQMIERWADVLDRLGSV